jgi:hypothetical protein
MDLTETGKADRHRSKESKEGRTRQGMKQEEHR